MENYIHSIVKLADAGLQLRLPVDLVPPNQYSRFTNAETFIEGQLVGRTGIVRLSDFPSAIHSIHRLNQEVFSIPGNRLVGAGTGLYASQLDVDPDSFRQILNTMSGQPLVMINFRFDQDEATWAIIIDGNSMWKFRDIDPNPSTYFFRPLGNLAPTVAAIATDGGVGNLNSTGGVGYDWRYTYLDGEVKTEGNPSPITMTPGSTQTIKPTANTNAGFLNPTFAYDGSSSTGSQGSALSSAGDPAQDISCVWKTFVFVANSSGMTLSVDASGSASQSGAGSASASILYSLDGGATFTTISSCSASPMNPTGSMPRQVFSIVLPDATPTSSVQVKGLAHAFAGGGSNPERFGSAGITVFDISMLVTIAPTTATLSLVNRQAKVCVVPSTNPAHTYIRLYRRGGSLPDNWRRSVEIAVSTLTQGGCSAGSLEIIDNVSDATLENETILDLDNDMPVTSVTVQNQPLSFIWGPSNGYVLGCGDPNRPESVYFSKTGNADAWPPGNFIEVSDPGTPIIAGCIYNTRTYAFSTERIYELVFGLIGGVTWSPFVTPSGRGVVGKFAFCVYDAIYFCSKDGIYRTSGNPEESLVESDIKPLFPTKDGPGRDVNGYEAVDMNQPDSIRLTYHNDEIWFKYIGLTSQVAQVLIYDTKKKRWRSAKYPTGTDSLSGTVAGAARLSNVTTVNFNNPVFVPFGFSNYVGNQVVLSGMTDSTMNGTYTIASAPSDNSFTVSNPGTDSGGFTPGGTATVSVDNKQIGPIYSEPNTISSLLLGNGIHLDKTEGQTDAGSDISVEVRTGAQDQGIPLNRKEYGDIIFDLDPGGGTVTIVPYVNGDITPESTLTVGPSTGRRQVPMSLGDIFAFNVSFDISWAKNATADPVMYQFDIMHRIEPAALTHWQTRETSIGGVGYQHIRDMYVAIRSTTDVTMQVVFDGTTQTYTVPSTSGQRRKVYIPLDSNKGKLYQFIFDAPSEFNLYQEDIEVRSKPWLGLLGYSVSSPFGGEQ